MLAEAGGQGRN